MPRWCLKGEPDGGNVAIYSTVDKVYSSSAVALGVGAKTFEVSAGLPIQVDDWFFAEYVPDPRAFMVVKVTGYSGTTLSVNSERAEGSGTGSSWRLVDCTPLFLPGRQDSMQRLQWSTANASLSTTPALTQQVTITIPAMNDGDTYEHVFDLFAHGQSGPQMVEGTIIGLDGVDVSLSGSVPVWMQTNGGNKNGFGTLVTLGCNATHVVAIVSALLGDSPGIDAPSQDITIKASVFNFGTDAVLPGAVPGAPLMRGSPGNYLTIGRGRIDTRRRYPRRVTSGHEYAIPTSETMTVVGSGKTASPSYAQSEIGWRWRYSCDGYVQQTERAWNGSATTGGSANASVVRVTK